MKYYKRSWNENRGDEHDNWGTVTYYFEIDGANPLRQIEIYESGRRLKYSTDKQSDEFGMLIDQFDETDFAPFEIQKEEFDKHWAE